MNKIAKLGVALCALLAPSFAIAEEVTISMWGRVDPTGPLRIGNIVRASEQLNDMLAASGSDITVKVDVIENPAKGWDVDALDLLKAFAVGRGPDIYLVRHDLLAEFVDAGYAANMDEFMDANPWYFDDVIPAIYGATTYKGSRWGIAQDSEIRQFFINKDMLREIGKSEEFIAGLGQSILDGDFTFTQLGELTKEVVDAGAADYGILHRPNIGPEFTLMFMTNGVKFQDAETGDLLFPKAEMLKTFEWFKWAVDNKVISADNTNMSWGDIASAFKQERAFAYHHGVFTLPWQLGDENGNTWPEDKEGYFNKIDWLMMPPAEKGGKALTLTTPIAYVISEQSEHKELAQHLLGLATLPWYNSVHAVTTFHTPILAGQASMTMMKDQWALREAAPYLEMTTFQPIHPKWGTYLSLIYKAIQGIETGRLSPEEAVDFVASEASAEIGDGFVITESAS